MTTINVQVAADDFDVIVEEDTQYQDYGLFTPLVDENGNTLVDENGNTLVVPVVPGEIFVVQVPPDDFDVIVEEDTP